MQFDVGQHVFLFDEQEKYLVAQVVNNPIQKGKPGTLLLNGKEITINESLSSKLLSMDSQSLNPVEDMVTFNDLNEAALLHNLRLRFNNDDIYTYVSTILIAVNPFKLLPLYTPTLMDKYIEQDFRSLPPHIFSLTQRSYRNLLENNENQSIVISGESGSGKTESMKLILMYLAEISGRQMINNSKSEDTREKGNLEQQILRSNPIMEAFGNAKTIRNNNSSRFGKWTTIAFNAKGGIVGGSIQNYLLEKSRVVGPSEGERNYHVFYQLIQACSSRVDLSSSLHLTTSPQDYNYLNKSSAFSIENVNDAYEFEELEIAMNILNITIDEKNFIFRTLSAILNLGNINFVPIKTASGEEGVKIGNPEQITVICKLLCLREELLTQALCFRNIGTRSIIFVSYNLNQALDARDALSKTLYGNLFDWLIQKINKSLLDDDKSSLSATNKFIGVLDIFGFEVFDVNSFEQMCINYCNEKLQNHFNEHIFSLEKLEYEKEGVDVKAVEFSDNSACLELLESNGSGIFAMLDDEINVPKGSDLTFLQKIKKNHAANKYFPKTHHKLNHENFDILHYAGQVSYNVANFLEKNRDRLYEDLVDVILISESPFIRNLFPKAEEDVNVADSVRARQSSKVKRESRTIASRFKKQLSILMSTINLTVPHFIRCLKPNSAKKGGLFSADMIISQMKYSGLLEVCRIRQYGYPQRKSFSDFLYRYKCFSPKSTSYKDLLVILKEKGILKEDKYAVGKSKIYLKNDQSTKLELSRAVSLNANILLLQRIARSYIVRKKYKKWMKIKSDLRYAINAKSEERLDMALYYIGDLPFQGNHIKEVKQAKELKQTIVEENRVIKLLRDAILTRELRGIISALETAEKMLLVVPEIEEARVIIKKVQEEKLVKEQLKNAILKRDKAEIKSLLTKAFEMDLIADEVREGQTLMSRILEEENCLENLKNAIANKSIEGLGAWLAKSSELGLKNNAEILEAKNLREILSSQLSAKLGLKLAIKSREISALQNAVAKAKSVDLNKDCEELSSAVTLLDLLIKQANTLTSLNIAMKMKVLSAINDQLNFAYSLNMNASVFKELDDAKRLCNFLVEEEIAIKELKESVAKNDEASIRKAISRAEALGMTYHLALEEGMKAISRLGGQSSMRDKLNNGINNKSITVVQLKELLKEVEAFDGSSSFSNDIITAKRKLERLEEEESIINDLTVGLKNNDIGSLQKDFDIAKGLNMLGGKHEALLNDVFAALNVKSQNDKFKVTILIAISSKDYESAIAALKTSGLTEEQLGNDVCDKLKNLKEEIEISNDIEKNIKLNDLKSLSILVEKAKNFGIDNPKIQEGRIICSRIKSMDEIRKKLATAVKNRNFNNICVALEEATAIALSEEEMKVAKKVRNELQVEADTIAILSGAINTLLVKLDGSLGIVESDLNAIKKSLEMVKDAGLVDDTQRVYNYGLSILLKGETQLELQTLMTDALKEKDVSLLKKLLIEAQEIGMKKQKIIEDVRNFVRDSEALSKEKKEKSKKEVTKETVNRNSMAVISQDEERKEKLRLQKCIDASSPKYNWINFVNIRTPDDYASGIFFSSTRNSVKANQFHWQKEEINKSMTAMSKENNKRAKYIYKSILGYCGERQYSFPQMLANEILQIGVGSDLLADEIYVQLCKHINNNMEVKSLRHAWQLMSMCVSTFSPSPDFEYYLLNFIRKSIDDAGPIGVYAKFCQRRLLGIVDTGMSGYVPSVEEIKAYDDRPPVLVSLLLVDGTVICEDLPITPDTNVENVIDMCVSYLDMDPAIGKDFGIFVQDIGNNIVNTSTTDAPVLVCRPLRNQEYLGSIVIEKQMQKQLHKFVFKRKIYLASANGGANKAKSDPMYARLVFLQDVDDFINDVYRYDNIDDVIYLITLSIMCDQEDCSSIEEKDLENVLEYIPLSWKKKNTKKDWISKVHSNVHIARGLEPEAIQSLFLEKICLHSMYGSHFFLVEKQSDKVLSASFYNGLPRFVKLAVNVNGLHVCLCDNSVVKSWSFSDIIKWWGNKSKFLFKVLDQDEKEVDLVFLTTLAQQIAGVMLDVIAELCHTFKV